MLRVAEPKQPVEIEAELSVPSVWRGWGWPEHVTIKWADETNAYRIRGEMGSDGPVMTEIHITGKITPETFRQPFTSIMRNSFAKAALGQERLGGGYSKKSGVRVRVPVGNGRPIDPMSARQRLGEVAKIWTRTGRGNKAGAVSDHFGISRSYAYLLITEARKQGLIPH